MSMAALHLSTGRTELPAEKLFCLPVAGPCTNIGGRSGADVLNARGQGSDLP
jgi:hypothetical protein